jgi:flavin reductase (DIM6/NTAB) family NADH-FMN oxidoreductase RutF
MEETDIRESFRFLKPHPIAFVISHDEGKPNGMICGWFTKLSYEPPLIGVSLLKEKNTQRLIKKSNEFVLAVANKELMKEANLFGYTSGAFVDKFSESNIETESAKFVKCPLIKKATLNFECKLVKELEVGDHILFIGEVLAAHINKNKKILLTMRETKDGRKIFEEI